MTGYDSWRRERLAELDEIATQIKKLPPTVRSMVLGEANLMRRSLLDMTYSDSPEVRRSVELTNRRLAAELDRITVAPVNEGQSWAEVNGDA